MKTNWTIITIENKNYYTLKEVCKELGFKTQKAFVEAYENLVHVFKGIIVGKFVSVEDFNSFFLDNKKEVEVETTPTEDFSDEKDIPIEVKKKFAKVLVTKYHPDNGGDSNMFLWANRLREVWEKSVVVDTWYKVLKMTTDEFLVFMETYKGEDKKELYKSRGYDEEGNFVF